MEPALPLPEADATVIVADWLAVPPVPVQINVKGVVVVKAAVVKVPDVGCVPNHPPEAVHDVASVDDQVNTDVALFAIEAGLALKETVGNSGAAATLTIADLDVVPPGPLQVNV
ncbi:MAG: hypothetical protein WCP96_09690 [Methylococcaceae bacterium]